MGIIPSRTYRSQPGRTAACTVCNNEEETPTNDRLTVRRYSRPEELSDEEPEPVPEGREAGTPPPKRRFSFRVPTASEKSWNLEKKVGGPVLLFSEEKRSWKSPGKQDHGRTTF